MKEKHSCQVCFQDPSSTAANKKMLICGQCGASAHKFCYMPSIDDESFVCQFCRLKEKGVCKYCGNQDGMMRKVGQHWAHPLCLFTHPGIIVEDFSTLKFLEIGPQKTGNKLKCEFCKNSTASVFQCQSNDKCGRASHIYCALKHYQPKSSLGWRLDDQPLPNDFDNQEAINNLLMRTIRRKNELLASWMEVKYNLQAKPANIFLLCDDHSNTVVDCSCQTWIGSKIDWLFCQSCFKWQHRKCVQMNQRIQKAIDNKNIDYQCNECLVWKEWVQNPFQRKFPEKRPKLHLYDYVFIHWFLQKKQKQTPISVVELVKKIPILPGLQFGELFFKEDVEKKLRNKINLKEIQREFNNIKTKEQLFKNLLNKWQILNLVWYITDGNLFSLPKENEFYIPDTFEEAQTSNFVSFALDLLLKYKSIYFTTSKSKILTRVKDKFTHSRQEVQKIHHREMKLEERVESHPKEMRQSTERQDVEQQVANRLQTNLFDDFPETLLTSILLRYNKDQEQLIYALYKAEMKKVEKKFKQLEDQREQLPPETLPTVKALQQYLDKLEQHIQNNVHDKNLLKRILSELFLWSSLGRIPKSLEYRVNSSQKKLQAINPFRKMAEKAALNMTPEIKNSELILEGFEENKVEAQLLSDNLQRNREDNEKDLGKKKTEIIDAFGSSPIHSKLTAKNSSELKMIGSSHRFQKEAIRRLNAFYEKTQVLTFQQGEQLMLFFNNRSIKGSQKLQQLKKLESEVNIVKNLKENYYQELEMFQSQEENFNDMNIQNIVNCKKIYKALSLFQPQIHFLLGNLAKYQMLETSRKVNLKKESQLAQTAVNNYKILNNCFRTEPLEKFINTLK